MKEFLLGDAGGDQGGEAEQDLSPTGNGGEGGGALHGIADKAEVGGGIGGDVLRGERVRRAARVAEAVVARFGHLRG